MLQKIRHTLVLALMGLFINFMTPSGVMAGEIPKVAGNGILAGPAEGIEGKSYVSDRLLPGISNGFVVFTLGVSVIMIIIAGMMYILSSGDSDMIKRAKDIIFWTIVGVIISILAYAIVSLVVNINFNS